jgi:hypothetical protein
MAAASVKSVLTRYGYIKDTLLNPAEFFSSPLFSKSIKFTIYNLQQKNTTTKTIDFEHQTYKLFSDSNMQKMINMTNHIKENFETVISNTAIEQYSVKCNNFEEFNNNIIEYQYTEGPNITTLDECIKIKLVEVFNDLLEQTNLISSYYTYMPKIGAFTYISTYNYKPSLELNKRKIHLMVLPEYHMFVIILLLVIFIHEPIILKTDMNYYSWKIKLNGNKNNNDYFTASGRSPSIVIYTQNLEDFTKKIHKLITIFKILAPVVGLNLVPSLNIKINELIYYSIETRQYKLDNINNLEKDCSNMTNYNKYKFSEIGKNLWNDCNKQPSATCESYSNSLDINRFSYSEPLCVLNQFQCIPKPLKKCGVGQFINNLEELNQNEHLCTDVLCLQDVKGEDNIMAIEKGLSSVESGKPEVSAKAGGKTNKYMKYKIKYLKEKMKKLNN